MTEETNYQPSLVVQSKSGNRVSSNVGTDQYADKISHGLLNHNAQGNIPQSAALHFYNIDDALAMPNKNDTNELHSSSNEHGEMDQNASDALSQCRQLLAKKGTRRSRSPQSKDGFSNSSYSDSKSSDQDSSSEPEKHSKQKSRTTAKSKQQVKNKNSNNKATKTITSTTKQNQISKRSQGEKPTRGARKGTRQHLIKEKATVETINLFHWLMSYSFKNKKGHKRKRKPKHEKN